MELSPPWEADSHLASQEIDPEGSLLCSQEHITGPYPEPDESSPHPPNLFKVRFNIIPPYIAPIRIKLKFSKCEI
jgi:hypothetical protein